MPRNSYRSHNGRSAIARKVMFSATGPTDGTIPQGYIPDSKGRLVRKAFFGGNKKQEVKELDKAIKVKYEKLNNEVLPKVAHDKQARIGCKGKDKYWYGYKKHASVDMQSGLISA